MDTTPPSDSLDGVAVGEKGVGWSGRRGWGWEEGGDGVMVGAGTV